MPRPKRERKMHVPPSMNGFRPFGIPIKTVDAVKLLFEEYETLKLADYKNLTQEEAAMAMNVSRPTFTRIYNNARKKIAEAFIEGKAIFIQGGNVCFEKEWYKCNECNEIFSFQADEKNPLPLHCEYCESDNLKHISEYLEIEVDSIQEKEVDAENKGTCLCLECGKKIPHQTGVPCREMQCPRCGKSMIRENSFHHQLMKKRKGKH